MTQLTDDISVVGPHFRTLGVPQRELRLLVDGVHDWLSRHTRKGGFPGFLGVLESGSAEGVTGLLKALTELCSDLGITTAWSRAFRASSFPPGVAGEILRQAREATERTVAGASEKPASRREIDAEVSKALGAAPGETPDPLPALGPELDRARLVDAFARSFLDLGSRRPLILMVEDFSSLDAFSIEVFHHLTWMLWLRRGRPVTPRILIIAGVRESTELFEALGELDFHHEQAEAFRIRARGYAREDLREVAQLLLGEESPLSFRERVFRLTQGDVTHSQWILRHVRERGGLEGKDLKVSNADLSFTSLVHKRLSALRDEERRCIALLAAVGRPIPRSLLEAALGESASAEPMLDQLEQGGWILSMGSRQPQGGPEGQAAGPERQICLAEPCLGDIVLEGLKGFQPVEIHARWASAFTSAAATRPYWRHAAFRHACLAGETERVHALSTAAVAYLDGLGCQTEALELLEEAIDHGNLGAEERAELTKRRAVLLTLTGYYHEAIECSAAILRRAKAPEERARLYRQIGDLHGQLGETEAQFEAYSSGLSALGDAEPCLERLNLLASIARGHLKASDLEASLECLEKCLHTVASMGPGVEADYHEVYSLAEEVHFRRSDYVEAAEFERCLLRRFEEAGNLPRQLQSLRYLSHLHFLRGEGGQARSYLLRAIEVARTTGSRWLLARALSALGRMLRDLQEPEEASRLIKQAAAMFSDLGRIEAALSLESLALVLDLELGHFSSAGRRCLVFAEGWTHPAGDGQTTWAGSLEAREALASAADRRSRILRLEKPAGLAAAAKGAESVVLAQLFEDEGRVSDAEKLYRACLEDGALESSSKTRSAYGLGRISVLRGDLESALRFFETGLKAQGAAPVHELVAEAYLGVSGICLDRGELSRSFDYAIRGLKLSMDKEILPGVLGSFAVLSAFFAEVGLFAEASRFAEGLLHMARHCGAARWEVAARRLLLGALAGLGPSTAATCVAAVGPWQELVARLDIPIETCRSKLELGWQAHGRKSYVEALNLAREGIEVARACGFAPLLDELLHLVGRVESDARNPRKNFLRAMDALENALQGAESRRRPRLRWVVLRDMAEVFRERGKKDLGDEYERRAAELEAVSLHRLAPPLRDLRWSSRGIEVPRLPHGVVESVATLLL